MATTTPPTTTYDIGNAKPIYIDEAVKAVIATSNTLLSILPPFITSQELGQNKVLKWAEDYQVLNRGTLNNGGVVVNTDTEFIVVDASKYRIGSYISFKNEKEVMKITEVDQSTNTLTVERSVGIWDAPASVADGTYINTIAKPREELSRAISEGIDETSSAENWYQTFRKDVPFSESVPYLAQYGNEKEPFIAYVLDRKTRELQNEMARSMMLGFGQVGSKTIPPTMDGIFEFMGQAGTNKRDAGAVALTGTALNNVIEDIFLDDSDIANLVIYCGTTQARKIATLNTTLANRMEIADFNTRTVGGATYKEQFVSDLPISAPTIFIDKDMPNDSILLLNRSKLQPFWAPGGSPIMWDSKPPDAPPSSRQMSMMWTASIAIKDAKYSHGLLYNLATS